MLFVVQGDSEYVLVRRRGRFAVPVDCAASPAHLEAAVREHQELMIEGLAKRGYEYVDDGFEMRGPLPHIEFSDNVDPDPGPDGRPDPRDLDAVIRWEKAEKARTAKRLGQQLEMVDYELVATFRRKIPGVLSTIPLASR